MWTLKEVKLDEQGADEHGWNWGLGLPLFHFSDGIDSLTIRAKDVNEAVNIFFSEGYPPLRIGRFNWGREYKNDKANV